MKSEKIAEMSKANFRMRIGCDQIAKELWESARTLKHLKNMYLVLREECYLLSKGEEAKYKLGLGPDHCTDEFLACLKDPEILRALLYGRKGGRKAEKVLSTQDLLKDLEIFKDMRKAASKLQAKSVFQMFKDVKAAFKSFYTKRKNGDDLARPPRPRKLSKSRVLSIPIDQDCLSLKKKDLVGLNVNGKMIRLKMDHKNLLKVVPVLSQIKAAEILCSEHSAYVKFIYDKEKPDVQREVKDTKRAGLDLGVKHTAAVFIEDETSRSKLYHGKTWIEYNCKWNRKVSKLKSQKDKLELAISKKIETENESAVDELADQCRKIRLRLSKLFDRRQNFFRDQMHKLSRRVLEDLKADGVTDLYLSANLGWLKNHKSNNLGSRVGQKFYQIPMMKFHSYLVEKSAEYGLTIHNVDEAYTSKTSVLSGSIPEAKSIAKPEKNACQKEYRSLRSKAFQGRREHRGLFKDRETGASYHADIGGAANHLAVDGPLPRVVRNWLKKNLWKLANPVISNAEVCFIDRPLLPV